MDPSLGVGATVDGRFRLEELAGTGGMAKVFRARDLRDQRQVAVKLLESRRASDLDRFRREAGFLAQVSHPGLAGYVAHGVSGDTPFLVQEWIEGVTLYRRLVEMGCSVRESVQVVRAVAEALAVLHSVGIVHRDVKPANIILDGEDVQRPRIVDLGVARLLQPPEDHTLTKTGTLLGTPGYMSPEQAQGMTRQVGPAADVFALGCILYECLSGVPAFAGVNAMARRTKVLLLDPLPVSTYCTEAPPELVALVRRMMAKDVAVRPATMAEVLAALPDGNDLPERPRRPLGWAESVATAAWERANPPPMSLPLGTRDTVVCAILAAKPEQTLRDEEHAVLDPSDSGAATVRVLEDGSVAALLHGNDPEEAAAHAARLALRLRSKLHGVPIVVVTSLVEGKGGRAAADALEWAFRALELRALQLAVSPAGADVQLDEQTAALLPASFRIRRLGDRIQLVGEGA